ncbi:hypothetical protein [Nocardia sp. NPDC006630]
MQGVSLLLQRHDWTWQVPARRGRTRRHR